MCDKDHFLDDLDKYLTRGAVTRRQFGALVGAGISMMLPRVVNAVAVTEADVTVTTPDGSADCYFVHPASGAAAGVLIWPDIFGLRPAFRQMGKRLAESGYSVLVVNPFYRVKKAPTAPNGAATPIPELMPLAKAREADASTYVFEGRPEQLRELLQREPALFDAFDGRDKTLRLRRARDGKRS